MYFNEHAPPHFHAHYQGFKATFSILTGQMIEGKFPQKQAAFVTAWALMHQKDLKANWKSVTTGKEPKKIKPLA